jgi:carboxypeptidase C (cathepsin A)
MRVRAAVVLLLLGLALPGPLPAQARAAAPPAAEARLSVAGDSVVETRHVARIGGQEVRYTARAGTLLLRHDDGRPRGHIFFVAYERDRQDVRARPITFSYNGGPGAASIWLHMGMLGPKRIQMGSDGFQQAPPFEMLDNTESLLDVTDIVMIDPVQTGYSRAAEGEDPRQFLGVRQDIESISEFIRLYLTKYDRWPSPKYLLGESYGTVRSAGVAEHLQARHNVELNGIVLVSSVIDLMTLGWDGAPGNDIPYAGHLPTFTATAWYHGRLPADLQGSLEAAVAEAREFAFGEYLLAMAKGSRLTPQERRATAQRLARLTGLSPEYVERANLRVSPGRFRKELLRDRGLTVGRLDSRLTALDADAAGESPEFDPSMAALGGPYTAMFVDYLRNDLGWRSDLQYYTGGRVAPWDYSAFSNRYLNLVGELRSTMARNPYLHVLVANGYYDIATPFAATEYTFDHLGYEQTYRDRVRMTYYEGGHMMYTQPELLRRLNRDVADFVRATQGGARVPVATGRD